MCDICYDMNLRRNRSRDKRTLKLHSGAWVLMELRLGMGAERPHPDAIKVTI